MYIILLLSVLFVGKIESICIEQICDTLQDVPLQNVKLKWTYVHFSSYFPTTLQYLPSKIFIDNGQLKFLTFKKILGGVHENSLQGLINLETIVFQNNFLPEIPENLFKNCPKLEKIVIKNCHLTTIKKGTFDLDYLEHLKLENNNLTEIKNGDVPKHLLELILTNNQITYIEENAFYDMKKLMILDLSENYLTTFEFKKYLIKTPRIHEIKIGSNYLDHLTVLPRLYHLKYFYAENNSLTKLDDYIFESCQNLEIINLADNNLISVGEGNFARDPLKHVKKIYLSYNDLKCLEISFLKLFPGLEKIWFGMNNLNCGCYSKLDKYLAENSIISLYNYDIEIEKYNSCKYLLQ